MPAKNNGYGVMMPDTVDIQLKFDFDGSLIWVKTPSAELPAKASRLAGIATWFTETFQKKCAGRQGVGGATATWNTLAMEERSFLYMDVGRWGGKQGENYLAGESEHRDFGVVCGCHAVLCKFYNFPGTKPYCGGSDKAAQKIENALTVLCGSRYGVQIVKWDSIHSSAQSEDAPVWFFLGDVHLPIDRNNAPENEGPFGRVMGPTYSPLLVHDRDSVMLWHQQYWEGDIFRGGDQDLEAFLAQIEVVARNFVVHFVQVGDLYDLWIGLDRFFEPINGPPGEMKLVSSKRGPTAKEVIEHWMGRADSCYPTLTKKLKTLKVRRKIFLYGNHDNYLACFSPGLQARVRNIRESGLYCEHGHWVDEANYDGATSGHRLTNAVFAHKDVRSADPQRVHFYTSAAALSYYNAHSEGKAFGIFVMAHSHMPYLTKVRITKIERRQPAGGILEPRDAGV